MTRLTLTLCLIGLPAGAVAQDGGNHITFRAGLGPEYAPGYFGAEDSAFGVGAAFSLESLSLGPFSAGGTPQDGLRFGGSFRFVGARTDDDFDELAGLPDIDASLEMGGSVKYRLNNAEAFVALRYGVVGHESFVAEVGADYEVAVSPNVTVTVGPRALWGDDDYAQTYFGVSDAAAGASDFEAFAAGGGLVSAGVIVEAIYAINENWEVVGTVRYDQLLGDAADSPITVSDDQLSTTIAVTRRFSFSF